MKEIPNLRKERASPVKREWLRGVARFAREPQGEIPAKRKNQMTFFTASLRSAIPEGTCAKIPYRAFCFHPASVRQAWLGLLKTKIPQRGCGSNLELRREGGSNPRSRGCRTTVFETAAFDHSAISPK